MTDIFARSELIIGKDSLEKLKGSKVAVFGVGGVGSYTVEALARTGVGTLLLIDGDKVDITNINRQLIALNSTVGQPKVKVASTRVKDINPEILVEAREEFITPETDLSFLNECNYVVDAIDNVSAKLHIIKYCKQKNIPIISAMGAGNKTNPALFEVADIYKTSICPLCRTIRRLLREQGIKKLKVVYSKEEPKKPQLDQNGRPITGSLSFVPSVMGLIIAREVVFDILGDTLND